MRQRRCWLLGWLILFCLTTAGLGQKVKVGYDKSIDFSTYKTYTWAQPAKPPVRMMLYANIVGMVDEEMKAKGFQRVDKDGDLTLIAGGGIGFGSMPSAAAPAGGPGSTTMPSSTASMWVGEAAPSGPVLMEGTFILQFVD